MGIPKTPFKKREFPSAGLSLVNRSWTEPKEKFGFATLTNQTEIRVRFPPIQRTHSEREVRFRRISELETNLEWNRGAVFKTADFTCKIGEIGLGPINAYHFTSYRNLKEGYFQYSKWICTLIPDLSRSGSAILNERNRTKSSTTHFLTNGTELKVPLQKVSEPTRNRRESSLILRLPRSSRNCTNESGTEILLKYF